jgi:shikimate kinase
MVEEAEGAEVADIITYAGEEYFREKERELIEEVAAAEDDVVVSTGGGVPAWRDNMERMNAIGQAVYLRRTAEQIASRLSPHGRQKRPKLRGLNDEELVAFMRSNMAEREPFYSKARYCIDCAAMSDEELIETILSIVKSNG